MTDFDLTTNPRRRQAVQRVKVAAEQLATLPIGDERLEQLCAVVCRQLQEVHDLALVVVATKGDDGH
ncbi:MAG: hypothetical protein EPN91_00080 [Salinibacterium sp.]|nr:MAG: hypothetical protein EPN91_00080 [Salinibacterium sp.]